MENKYSEIVDQARLTAASDRGAARQRSRPFDKLCRAGAKGRLVLARLRVRRALPAAFWSRRARFRASSSLTRWRKLRDMETMPTIQLQEEVEYFERHRLELLAQAPGRYALVKGSTLVDTFASESEAVRAGYLCFGNEAFLVKHIVEADIPLIFATFNLGM